MVDDHPGHRDPRRMMASRLEINVHLRDRLRAWKHAALVGAVNQAQYLVAGKRLCSYGLAGCYAAVLREDRREGIAH